jgi:CRP-like cAMP-binding protein
MTTKARTHATFLEGASEDLRDLMTGIAVQRDLKKGEALFEQGDQGDALFAVISGSLEVSEISTDGRKLSLNILHEGAVFGEICLFDPGVRTATVTALEDCSVSSIRNPDMTKALLNTPSLNADMIQLAGRRLRWIASQVSEQVFLPLPARLARKVLHLMDNGSTQTNTLVMSQSDLAEFVGASREAVSKTLSSWKSVGVIDLSRGGLVLLNRTALGEIADLIDY